MKKHLLYILLALLLISCSSQEKKFVIGVSQCSEDIWREKQNAELRIGSYIHDNIELRFAAAYDSDERQVQQIDSLVATGIDLLIVAPNQVATISPAIDRAYDSGIPVIVFERKTNSKKYTACVSADNYEMGHIMGEYIASRLKGKGSVLEIKGLEGSSPAIERHNGFMDAIKENPGISTAGIAQGDWTGQSAYLSVKKLLAGMPSEKVGAIDYVFAQNDRMAMGARKAFMEYMKANPDVSKSLPLFSGIDGLSGEDGGIRLVRDSILDATYVYPTQGDKLIELAVNILEGKPYEKENLNMAALVTKDNAKALLMKAEDADRQSAYLDQLHDKVDTYLGEISTQRTVMILAFGAILLLVIAMILGLLYHQGQINMRRQRMADTLWNMEAPAETEKATEENPADSSPFFIRFKEAVEARLSDSELSVEDLAADMNLSRVQLYRKVKAISNSSPVELLRMARLNRGYQMLLNTDKSISEIAYAVGFTAPSYFTKCFKEEFGVLPGDVRNKEQ